MAETNLEEPKRDVHDIHPSLANLAGTIGNARLGLSSATAPQSYKVQRAQPAANLQSGDLRPFKVSGEKNFIILVDDIQLFDDKTLTTSTHSTSIALEKECIVSGTYLYDDNNVVLLGNPYNVYCKATDVEPQDLSHSTYIPHNNNNNNENELQSTPPNPEQEQKQKQTPSAPAAHSDEFIMVSLQDKTNKTQPSDHEPQDTMHVINMDPATDAYVTYTDGTSDTVQRGHNQSVTAGIPVPEVDVDGYPEDVTIVNLEENRPSFIQTLPPKQASVTAVRDEEQLHRPSTEQLVERRRSGSGSQTTNHANTYNRMPSSSIPTPQRHMNEYKYFFNHFLYRTLLLSVTLLFVSVLLMPEWFRAVGSTQSFKSAYGLSAFGIFVIFLGAFGSICGGVLEFAKIELASHYKRMFIYFIMAMYIMGGAFYFIGACAVTGAYNALLGRGYVGYGGVWWCEMFYVAVVSIVTGIDLKIQILNRWDLRVSLFVSLLVFDGLILSICSMVIGGKPLMDDTFTTLGVMYLFSALLALVFLVFRLLTVVTQTISANYKIELGLMTALLIFMVCSGFTYWALAAQQTVSASASYYVGMGVLQIVMGLFMTFDVSFCQFVIPRLCVKK